MKFIFKQKFNLIDLVFFALAIQFAVLGKYGTAIGFFLLGVVLSTITDGVVSILEKDRQWKDLADEHKVIEAIKACKMLRKVDTDTAVFMVRGYINRKRKL